MQQYILRRLLLMVPTLLGITIVVFMVVRFIPGDVVDSILGDYGAFDRETKEELIRQYKLDGSIPQQYVEWMGKVLQGDLGASLITGRAVVTELKNRIPVTFELGFLAILIALVMAIPIGIISALRQDTVVDHASRSFSIILLSIPNFWFALLVITLGGRYAGWAPPIRYVDLWQDPLENLYLMIIPAAILGAGLSATVMRYTRTQMLEVMRQDYIRTAWAKGLRERTVVVRHAVKNAFIPVITVIGLLLPVLFGGTVILETIFSIPGMGRYLVEAIGARDYPVVQGVNLLLATVVIVANLLVDTSYAFLDPRIRYR